MAPHRTYMEEPVKSFGPSHFDDSGVEHDVLEPVAVIGFSLKYPQEADSAESFWRMLDEKRCAMTEWPKDRVNLDAFYHRDDDVFVPGAHFLKEDLDAFDASFFGISATEAVAMDPQQRILLETAYRALENAGIPMESVSGSKTGVYSGSMADDYKLLLTKDADDMPKYTATGASINMVANRLSWFFNFVGPSVNMDSACSSSLMALDIACQGLRNGDASMALVAGGSMILAVEGILSLMTMSFLSPSGRCYSFDDRANGYSRGEGFGVVLIKRLSDAIRDGNTIRAVIRSTGSNQDGHTPGVTQPSKDSQALLIKETYQKAKLDFTPTRFFEAHGTGTAVGDPIEADAIGSAFRSSRTPQDPLYIGAVKANIGHLEGGSGVAGLIKTVMVLEKAVIPPNANFERLNDRIDAEFSNMKFPVHPTPWPTKGLRRASVNSFGFGGSNAHAVLDDAFHYLSSRGLTASHCTLESPPALGQGGPRQNLGVAEISMSHSSARPTSESNIISTCEPKVNGSQQECLYKAMAATNGASCQSVSHVKEPFVSPPKLLVWSAADEGGIDRLMGVWHPYFLNASSASSPPAKAYMDGLAHTLAFRRSSLPWKSFAIVDSPSKLTNVKDTVSRPVRSSKKLGLGFIFTGQGAQYQRMGAALYTYPVFRSTLESIEQVLRELGCEWSINDELSVSESSSRIHDPEYSQPLTTALQIALIEMLRDFNILPSLIVGHSSGEIAAAYAAGGLSLPSACKVSYYRGKFASALKNSSRHAGAMISVDLSEEDMHSYLHGVKSQLHTDKLHVACINSPGNVTLSGDEEVIDLLKSQLDSSHVAAHKLRTGVAYHSPCMREIASDYLASIQGLEKSRKHASRRPVMISTVTGEPIQDLDVLSTADYWVTNMVQPVQFSSALSRVVSQSGAPRTRQLGTVAQKFVYDLVEIGPHSALQRPIRAILDKAALKEEIRYSSILTRQRPALETLLELSGRLYSLGYPVALDKVNQTQASHEPNCHAFTDLPQYPFNHSRKYWHESSMSKHSRMRRHPRQELLGTAVPDWNPLEPRWRKFFDVSETPWIGDHKVNGRPIYPATGMVVMAIEGVKQLAEPGRPISGYQIKDATFSHPITISSTGTTEVQLFLRPIQNTNEKDSATSEYRICICEDGKWQETCRGVVQLQYEIATAELDGGQKESRRAQYYQEQYREALNSCTQSVKAERMYQHFLSNGLHYGPAFQALRDLAWDGKDGAIGKLQTFAWTPQQSHHSMQPHVVHPVTLDAAGQLMWVALTKGATEVVVNGAAVTRIQSAWLSSSGLAYPDATELRAFSTSRLKGFRGTDSSMFALDHMGNLKMIISHMETTAVSGSRAIGEETEPRRICYSMEWKPDIDLLTSDQIVSYCKAARADVAEPIDFYQDLGLVLFYFVQRTLSHIQGMDTNELKPHIRKYVAWLKMQVTKIELGELPNSQSDWVSRSQDTERMESIVRRIEEINPEGKLVVTVGRNLDSIIRGTVDPLQVLFYEGLAEAHYKDVCDRISSCRQLWGFLDIFAQKSPNMKILEVGAGTGSITNHILSPLILNGDQESGTARFSQYDYTDISEAFFEKAQEKFAFAKSRMSFKALNIEMSPEDQGYAPESYDLVVAAWVLHATRDLHKTVRNVRNLLKPGGKLVLLEITKPEILRNGFAFGTLPGYWLGIEECREWSPCISEEQWHQVLSMNGFSGVDFVLPDYQTETCHEMSLMVATASNGTHRVPRTGKASIIVDPESSSQAVVAHYVRHLQRVGGDSVCEIVSVHELETVKQSKDVSVLFLLELEKPFLYSLEEPGFKLLQGVLRTAQDIIWFTAAEKKSPSYPQVSMVTGLARVLCTENNSQPFVTVAVENHKSDPETWARRIVQVLNAADSRPKGIRELEYAERDGLLMINRVVEANHLNHKVHVMSSPTVTAQEFRQGPPLAMAVSNPGFLDSIRFIEDSRYNTDLRPDEIEIEVKSVGVNFRDLLVVLGRYGADTVGCECAGIVTRIGSDCSTVRPGDPVCAAVLGCIYTYARCNFQLAVKFPNDLSFAQAASLPITGVTAHYSLINIAGLQPEDSILIHSGAGGTGQMAIQIAQSIGAELFVTVGSKQKRQHLKEVYSIPEDHIFYSRDASFAKDIMRMTKDQGVDVVLNSLSGESLIASWESIAPFGRFIELGKADVETNSKLPMLYFAKNVSFSAVAVDYICANRPTLIQKLLSAVVDKVADGAIKIATPLHEFPISDIESAFRFMQSGKNTGKTVLNLNSADNVPMLLHYKPSYSFDTRGTYLIAGGLGGLGRSAARWMAKRGVKNLILLSRSGPKSQAACDLLKELEDLGVRVEAPKCDVSCDQSLSAALEQCAMMPPIKGCIQGTMVLKDSIFENMTFMDWNTSIRSKVHSSWNLHNILPKNMDFFIMLSSVAGVAGSPGQSNYAAGNTYQDALAHYRLAHGLKATSIDLGWMATVGIVAENERYRRGKEAATDLASIQEVEFLALLEYYCDPKLEPLSSLKAQPIIGLVTHAQFRSRGLQPPDWIDRPLFSVLSQIGLADDTGTTSDASTGTRDYTIELVQAGSETEAASVVVAGLLQKLSRALLVAVEDIDTERPLHVYGVDSLLAVELRNWFAKVFRADVAVFDITGQGTIAALGEFVAKTSALREESRKQRQKKSI